MKARPFSGEYFLGGAVGLGLGLALLVINTTFFPKSLCHKIWTIKILPCTSYCNTKIFQWQKIWTVPIFPNLLVEIYDARTRQNGCHTASDAAARALVPRLRVFFLDSRWLDFDSRRFLPNRSNSAGIRLYQPAAETGWNWLWMRPKHSKSVLPQFYFKYLLLLLCFLFCFVFLAFFFLCFVNQGHIMCFLRIF